MPRNAREAALVAVAERRGRDTGICLSAATAIRDFNKPSIARSLLHAHGITADRIRQLEIDDANSLLLALLTS